ncbi:MAG: DrmB family protein [Desulfomonilaceae bacterium]
MKNKPVKNKAHGQIRQSQLVTMFGPGAMIDLPDHSVLLAGLDHWTGLGDQIVEPRLTSKLSQLLGVPSLQLFSPPPDPDNPAAPITGITAWLFPEWFITQHIYDSKPNVRARMLVHRKRLTKGKFIDPDKKKRPVVPVRFVRACRVGHINDIDWYSFVHNGPTECNRQLWLDERGTSGDLSEVFARCECGKERSMAQASIISLKALGNCDGSRPWLGPYTKESCGEPNRLLIRTASNAYFPVTMSAISLPERDEAIKAAVDSVWEFLVEVEEITELKYERKKTKVKLALEEFSDEEIMAEIVARKTPSFEQTKPIKLAEFETLSTSSDEIGQDRPDGNFLARAILPQVWLKPWMKGIERVVLVHRIREIEALIGFTRFESLSPDIDGELEMGVRRAALSLEAKWLPAIENRGEGVFLQFNREAVESWANRPEVQNRARELSRGFERWMEEHNTERPFPGLPYIMLHSFSHTLITSVSLECGYPASSIRERIYALPGIGYGVLIHTGTTDAEGTLGGLIQVGRRIHEQVRNALEMSELCSNDPVCSQHVPDSLYENRFLHGAACHGCLLISETSCEQRNDFLDRALIAPTLDKSNIHFFNWPT